MTREQQRQMSHAISVLNTALDYGKPQPTFFSGNIASLSRVLSRVSTESIVIHDNGESLTQTVVYQRPR